ncbi:signal transduction histidine kinase regulating citrate/malate metabolism [Arthrobacter crystallopoietes BAB-32]|uniref:Signal transduction histidine kinase regulating citrate/malate metabolism n=1 Tax=Arthrobacter crystallopoietes BAB-32 TaxID=1246476 RepID=N1UYZ3_9MICC|nr:signal transduction histidine kinase regulating citrate/malate metabolism [Arthrobacter crystallopoietes BAB-32]
MKNWSLATRILVGQLVFLLLLTAAVSTLLFLDAREQNYQRAAQRMTSIGVAIADSPFVLEAIGSADPTAELQPYAEKVRRDAGVDFITIMAPDRTRYTHPNPAEIGGAYIGSIDQALAGEPETEVFAGTLGPSIRAIVPVKDESGTVRAMVAAGVTVSNVSVALNARLPFVFFVALAVMAASSLASWLLSRYLNRVTLGWGPAQLSRIFVFYETVLHSVREGMLLVDTQGRLVLYNDQAARMLGLPLRSPGDPAPAVASLGIPPALKDLLLQGQAVQDEVLVTDQHVLLVSQDPAAPRSSSAGGRTRAAVGFPALGSVAVLRDRTEVQYLTGELESMRTLRDALRAQTHEHSNRLHTIVSLIELGRHREALEFASRDLQQSPAADRRRGQRHRRTVHHGPPRRQGGAGQRTRHRTAHHGQPRRRWVDAAASGQSGHGSGSARHHRREPFGQRFRRRILLRAQGGLHRFPHHGGPALDPGPRQRPGAAGRRARADFRPRLQFEGRRRDPARRRLGAGEAGGY